MAETAAKADKAAKVRVSKKEIIITTTDRTKALTIIARADTKTIVAVKAVAAEEADTTSSLRARKSTTRLRKLSFAER